MTIDRATFDGSEKTNYPASPVPDGEDRPLAGPGPSDATDIASLWIDTGLGDPLTKEQHHHIPIGRPKDFFRTHPESAYRARGEIYVHKSENVIGEQFFRPCQDNRVARERGTSRLGG